MRTPKANFLCYSNKFLSFKLSISNNKPSINVQISSDNWPIQCKNSSVSMTKIVEADLAQAVLADHPAEMLGHVVGAQDLPTLIHADVIQIVPAVRAFEQPPVFDLPLLLSQQQFLNSGDQRQRAEAGLGFEHVLPYRDILAIHICLDHFVGNGDGFLIKVDSVPTESQHLAAAQAVISGDLDAEFQRITCDGVEQVKHLVLAVERTMEDVLFGPFNLIGGILCEDVLFHRALERLADDCVVMDHRIGGVAVIEDGLVKIFNVLGRETAQLDAGGREIRDHPGLHHDGIALISSCGNRGLDAVQPFHHVIRK